jgi:hypothetical protein
LEHRWVFAFYIRTIFCFLLERSITVNRIFAPPTCFKLATKQPLGGFWMLFWLFNLIFKFFTLLILIPGD